MGTLGNCRAGNSLPLHPVSGNMGQIPDRGFVPHPDSFSFCGSRGPDCLREIGTRLPEYRTVAAARRQRIRGLQAIDPRYGLSVQAVLVGGQPTLGLLTVFLARPILGGRRFHVSNLPNSWSAWVVGAPLFDPGGNDRDAPLVGRRTLDAALSALGLAILHRQTHELIQAASIWDRSLDAGLPHPSRHLRSLGAKCDLAGLVA